MPNRTWIFRSSPEMQDNAVLHRWCWRAIAPTGEMAVASLTFATLAACVADAQLHGFAGAVDPAAGMLSPVHYEIRVNGPEVVATPRAGG
ncbi:MAG TPA: hypothetical protein VHP37_25770 [Burkholderiales bacterium]|nr:hypothetical protein [Burkholderiales bacterium]